MNNDNAEGWISPAPGDEFVFTNIDEAGDTTWILINLLEGANDDDAGNYVFRSSDDPRILIELAVSTVMEAAEAGTATYTSHQDENEGKGVLVHGLETDQHVEIHNDEGEEKTGKITLIDTETDSFEIVWDETGEVSPMAETIHFEEAGLLPTGITNIVVLADENTAEANENAQEANENAQEANENTQEANENTQEANENTQEANENTQEAAVENTEEAAVENREEAPAQNTENDNMIEIDIVQELDAALRTYTEEEQEQSFIEDWIQHPLEGHPKRLLTSRFALIDLFRMFQVLIQDRINDDDSVIRIRNPNTRPFPLMPLSHIETVVYTDPNHGEQPNVNNLIVRTTIDEDVENFAQRLMSTTEAIVGGKTYDTMMQDMFEATQPWLIPEIDHDDPFTTEVTHDIPFMRISGPIGETTDHPLRVGAWKGVVEKEGSQRIRVFLGHQVPFSNQRAVSGRTRVQPDSQNIVAAMPADLLRTDGYLYVPQPSSRNDWINPQRSRVFLYDVRRSQPHITADSVAVFSAMGPSTVPIYTTAAELTKLDFSQPAILKTDLIDNLPPLHAYLSAKIGQKESPLILGWHDLQFVLDYVGRDTQSLPAAAHSVVAEALTKSIDSIIGHIETVDKVADSAITAIRTAAIDAGHRQTLALLNYANPLDETVQTAVPPEMLGISHWGHFGYSPEAWVRFGFNPVVERYWINKIRGVNATEELESIVYSARRVTQHIAARQLETQLLGHPRAEHNPCPHVPFADRVYTETRDETDGNLLAVRRILDRFGGKRDANWVYCFQCKKTLVCAHDLLLLDAREHPEDSDLIVKQIILRFGQHGIEGRRHMCGNCGKEWHGLDFDTDPLLAGGRGEDGEGDAMIIEEPDPDDVEWAAGEGYDGMWTDEGEIAAEAEGEGEAQPEDDMIAEDVIQETRTPLSKYPIAYRILRDIAGLAGINLTYEAEEKLVEMHGNFPRRPALRGRVKKDIEASVIRYLARYAACLIILSRTHPALLPVRVGAAIGEVDDDEDTGTITERSLAKVMTRSTLKHTPWRQLTQLSSGEAKALKDRTDEFFRQINRAVRSLIAEGAECDVDGECKEETAAKAAAELRQKFRVDEIFRPRLFATEGEGEKPDLSMQPGSSVLTYYMAIHTLMEALIKEAQQAPATPEQMGAHYLPGQSIPESLRFLETMAETHEELAGIPEYIVTAGAKYDKAFNASWTRTYFHLPLALFPIDKPSELILGMDDWRVLFAKVCATGTNEGGQHRFLRSGKCVYCGIPRPTEAEPAVVPSIEAGQALLDAIRRRNIVPPQKKQGVSELTSAAESIIEIFPGKPLTQNAVFAIIAIALKPAKGDMDVAKILGQSLKQLETRPPASLERGDVLKGLCRNPHAACRDIMQFIALPLARWASADDALLKTLRTVRSDYGLYMDHKRDVEGFFIAQQGRLPKIPKSDAIVAAAMDTARRIRALYKMRELWTTRIEHQLIERGVGVDMDISNIVFNMFLHSVLAALSPWLGAATTAKGGNGRIMMDFINGAIGDWYTWGQKVQLSAVTDVLLRHAEAEKDMLLREYESHDEDDKRILGVQKRLHIGRYEAGDVKRMDMAVYKRDAGLAAKLEKQVEKGMAR